MVDELEITPPNPRPGDQINVNIKGACDERVPVEINYEETVPVLDQAFTVQINQVHVPWSKNRLVLEAKNVDTMKVAAKFLIWIHKKVDVVNGVAQYTLRDVSKGSYSVKLSGTTSPETSEVHIKISASAELQLDKSGSCVYTFHPNPVHEGSLAVKCKGVEKSVEIKNQD
jgi:hypothetical protein